MVVSRLLDLRSAARIGPHARLQGTVNSLGEEARLADAGIAFEHDQTTGARNKLVQRPGHRGHFRRPIDERRWLFSGPAVGGDPKDICRRPETFEHVRRQPLEREIQTGSALRFHVAQDSAVLGRLHQAGGKVDVTAQHREVTPTVVAGRTDECWPAGDPDPGPQAERADLRFECQRRPHGTRSVVLVRERRHTEGNRQGGALLVHGDFLQPAIESVGHALGRTSQAVHLVQRLIGALRQASDVYEDDRGLAQLGEPVLLACVDAR